MAKSARRFDSAAALRSDKCECCGQSVDGRVGCTPIDTEVR